MPICFSVFNRDAHRRFPHNAAFTAGLLQFYENRFDRENWRSTAAENFFESAEIRSQFITGLAATDELPQYLAAAEAKAANGEDSAVYKLFRATAAIHRARFENAVPIYRELSEMYPHEYVYANEFVNLTRSFGQKNPAFLKEAAEVSRSFADFQPVAPAGWRVTAGEIRAEIGDYKGAREEWEKIIATAKGSNENYLDTATLFWDYFQYSEARRTIQKLRDKQSDPTLYAFQFGAICEAEKNMPAALHEYVTALAASSATDDDDESTSDARSARDRLTRIFKRGNNARILRQIVAAERLKKKNTAGLAFAFAEILDENGFRDEAAKLLKNEIPRTDSSEFINQTIEYFDKNKDRGGAELALKRLTAVGKTPHGKISAGLNLAELLAAHGKKRRSGNGVAKFAK